MFSLFCGCFKRQPKISCGQYVIDEKISHSSRTPIYVVRKNGKHYIAKDLMGSFAEYNILCFVSPHPNIVQPVECVSSFVIMEHLSGCNDLYRHVRRQRRYLTETMMWTISQQMMNVLVHLLNRRIVHNDISPENIMLNPVTMQVKLIDFEFAMDMHTRKSYKGYIGKAHYMPPEICMPQEECVRPEVLDIYSFGCVLTACLWGETPYRAPCFEQSEFQSLGVRIINKMNAEPHVSVQCQEFIQHLIHPDPQHRMIATELVDHKWLREIGEICTL